MQRIREARIGKLSQLNYAAVFVKSNLVRWLHWPLAAVRCRRLKSAASRSSSEDPNYRTMRYEYSAQLHAVRRTQSIELAGTLHS